MRNSRVSQKDPGSVNVICCRRYDESASSAVMNPPTQFPRAPSSFTFLPSPSNPNPTFNPNFFHFYDQNHPLITPTNPVISQPPPPPPTAPPPTAPPDLPSVLLTLKDLIRLSETTIDSISTLLGGSSAAAPGNALCPCPFNQHHCVPPESLFRHSLQCPSSPARGFNLNLLESLRYPNSFQSSDELIKQNLFVQTQHDPSAELCFSLDEYWDYGSNFQYRDCPGVVCSIDQDSISRTFTLPGILSVECANFIGSVNGEIKGIPREIFILLPSELWSVRTEIEAWIEYPTTYSYRVLRAILCPQPFQEYDFLRWVIVNSLHYGVLIDVPMRDHMVLLFQLCLKAIISEAVGLVNLVFTRDAKELNLVAVSFKCPILVEVLKWLSSQLSALYGKVNGKLFAISMLKQWLLNASLSSSLFPVRHKAPISPALKDADGKSTESSKNIVEDNGNNLLSGSISGRVIFVSQVAAAVAALHERTMFEEKVKALCAAQPLNCYQRMAEHAYLSRRADEERQKRSNYRPLLEHDGLLWQRQRNQETNKTKTREELLAEERDYKRRRMSYRGKKLKRSTTEVMRDIIEEHMEAIKRAGGIGCSVNSAEEAGKFSSEPSPSYETYVDELKKNAHVFSETSRELPHGNKEQLDSRRFEDESPEDRKRSTRDSSRHREHREAERSAERDRRGREYYFRSPDRQRIHGRSHDRVSNRRHRDDVELSRKSFPRSPSRRHSRSHERTNHQSVPSERNSEMVDRRQRHAYRDHRSDSVTLQEFEDRYDPSESQDVYEDDVSLQQQYA